MKYVIELPEDLKKMIIDEGRFEVAHAYRLAACVKAGVALPEHHGRLIDEDALNIAMEERMHRIGDDKSIWDASLVRTAMKDFAHTVIEATKKDLTDYITGATLLSVKEANKLHPYVRKASSEWWLRSPGTDVFYGNSAAYVGTGPGNVYDNGDDVSDSLGVRPALKIADFDSFGLKISDQFQFGNYDFTVISYRYALCNDIIGKSAFRKDYKASDASDYEASDVKKFVDEWFLAAKQQTRNMQPKEENDDEIDR